MFFILVVVVEVKDTFDWAKYLMEDEDLEQIKAMARKASFVTRNLSSR